MGKETILFKNEEKMTSEAAANLLRTLADKIEKGRITLTQGKKELTTKVPSRVEVAVKVEKEEGKKKVKKKIEFEIEWVVGEQKLNTPMRIK